MKSCQIKYELYKNQIKDKNNIVAKNSYKNYNRILIEKVIETAKLNYERNYVQV